MLGQLVRAVLTGLSFGITARIIGIPCPSPESLVGALAVVAATTGYIIGGWLK